MANDKAPQKQTRNTSHWFLQTTAVLMLALLSAACSIDSSSGAKSTPHCVHGDLRPARGAEACGPEGHEIGEMAEVCLHGVWVDMADCDCGSKEYGGDVVVRSRQDMNRLRRVTHLTGTLEIRTQELDSLKGLDSLRCVDKLVIRSSSLVSLDGLESLRHVRDLTIAQNKQLQDLSALGGMQDVNSSLQLSHNHRLSSLDGLQSLTHVGSNLVITDNPRLSSLGALSNLRVVGRYLVLRNNASLGSLEGIHPELQVGERWAVFNNERLRSLDSLHPAVAESSEDCLVASSEQQAEDIQAGQSLASCW